VSYVGRVAKTKDNDEAAIPHNDEAEAEISHNDEAICLIIVVYFSTPFASSLSGIFLWFCHIRKCAVLYVGRVTQIRDIDEAEILHNDEANGQNTKRCGC